MTIKATIELTDETGSKFLTLTFHCASDKPALTLTEADALRLIATQANPRAVLLDAARTIARETGSEIATAGQIIIPIYAPNGEGQTVPMPLDVALLEMQ